MTRPPASLIFMWAALVVPSWPLVDKYLQLPGLIGYTVAVALVLLLAPRWFAAIPSGAVGPLGAATLLALVIIFVSIYPAVNLQTANAGSDDDDGHNVGVAALLEGESPYTRTTYLGNQLHPLPGALLLAMPFALVWSSALQTLLWLPLFFLALSRETRHPKTALVLSWLILGLNPVVLHQLVTGSSYSANTISVLLGLWWLTREPRRGGWVAIAWGVTLCSRPNFLFLLPLAFGWLGREYGWRQAGWRVALTCGTVAALALPFYLSEPNFTPLLAWERVARYDAVVAHAGTGIVVAMALLSVGLACFPGDRARLFRDCALVQALPVVAGLLLSLGLDGVNKLDVAWFGSFASWFAVMAVIGSLEPWLSRAAPSAAIA